MTTMMIIMGLILVLAIGCIIGEHYQQETNNQRNQRARLDGCNAIQDLILGRAKQISDEFYESVRELFR